jgi:hypothetical protein
MTIGTAAQYHDEITKPTKLTKFTKIFGVEYLRDLRCFVIFAPKA